MRTQKERTSEKKPRLLKKVYHNLRSGRRLIPFYAMFWAITVAVIVLAALNRNWSGCFAGCLALVLFLLPSFAEESLRIELPTILEVIVVVFVFCAQILGEIGMYYTRFPFWDTMLHCTSGFLFAAFGFSLVDLCNRSRRVDVKLSPFFLSLVAFCFSMTVGVLWEFFEFGIDQLFATDMQRDSVIRDIAVRYFSPDGETPIRIEQISQTVIHTADGAIYYIPGYLEIGLLDTLKDLFVDCAGAVVFSVIGFFYVRSRGKGRIARQFIPVVQNPTATTEAAKEESACEKAQ